MSKLEKALEKAGELREFGDSTKAGKVEIHQEYKTKKISSPYVVTVNQPHSYVSEEYRRLKSMLIRETKSDFLNTIMVTSAIKNEGKSLTSVNLSIAMSQEIDHSVLLVDADLRNPMLHDYLGIDYKYGLSDYLMGDIDISEVLIRTGIGNMVFLPAGRPVENPVELLSSKKMKDLLNDFKHRYMNRYVIIDTPPILACPEGIPIGSFTDGVIFVVREGLAQRSFVENALSMIQGLNILGVVFNDIKETNPDGSYSQYYYQAEKER
jgi:exopolysaccharide/PEP-CTERM locus tyrosine autokinase